MKIVRIFFACSLLLLAFGLTAETLGQCPEDYCDTGCTYDYWRFTGKKWPDTSLPIHYYINENGADDCIGDEFRAVREGMEVWERVYQAYFAACYEGTTTLQADPNCAGDVSKDGTNVVSWKDLGGSSPLLLGRACWWYKPGTDSLIETDMTLNDNAVVKWSALSGDQCIRERFDVQSVAAHEFGHWMALNHSCDTMATMYCYIDSSKTFRRTLGECDKKAMRNLSPIGAYPHTAGAPKPAPGCWPWFYADGLLNSPAVGDINRDGKPDVVFEDGSGLLHVLQGTPQECYLWPDSTAMGVSFSGSPALGDVNGDGWLEIAFSTQNSKVYVIDHLKNKLPGWPKNIVGVAGTPAIGDIDNDGSMEIVVAATDWKVYAWNADGTLVPGWPYTGTGEFVNLSMVGLADLNDDDSLEVVVASFDGTLYAIKPHGANLPGWPASVSTSLCGSIAIGDIDSDNKYEIVVPGYWDSLYAVNDNGSRCAGWPVYVNPGDLGTCMLPPSLGNLDADAALEIVVGSSADSVYAFNGNGSRLAGWPVYVDGYSKGSPLILNIDSDAAMEVIAAAWDDKIYGFNNTGSTATGWPVSYGGGYQSTLVAADINGDQEVELPVGAPVGYVKCFHLGTLEGVNTYQWATFGHDNHRTCRYGYVPPEVTP
ncbi:MAG: FG-GAP-like repeat-containing protein, partial [Candidatus Eisenbacteria bacterium]